LHIATPRSPRQIRTRWSRGDLKLRVVEAFVLEECRTERINGERRPLFLVVKRVDTSAGRLAMKLRRVFIARVLTLLWALFWLVFFIAESLAWRTPVLVAAPWVGVGLLFALLALVPFRWEGAGGVLLVVLGVLVGPAYAIWTPPGLPLASRVITVLVLSGPPLGTGILFLRHHVAMTAGA
jgi:hypothetical protein